MGQGKTKQKKEQLKGALLKVCDVAAVSHTTVLLMMVAPGGDQTLWTWISRALMSLRVYYTPQYRQSQKSLKVEAFFVSVVPGTSERTITVGRYNHETSRGVASKRSTNLLTKPSS